ncbi:MAG: hypothetical protein AAGL68_05430 [Pseudomonadota bacterium]
MTKLAAILLPVAILSLAACGEEPTPVDTPTPEETIQAQAEDLPEPADRDAFAAAFSAACPNAKSVNNASCTAMGMGSPSFLCEYGLGDDEYLRHEGVVTRSEEGELAYTLDDPEKVCAQGA